jgi:hypothetical protein
LKCSKADRNEKEKSRLANIFQIKATTLSSEPITCDSYSLTEFLAEILIAESLHILDNKSKVCPHSKNDRSFELITRSLQHIKYEMWFLSLEFRNHNQNLGSITWSFEFICLRSTACSSFISFPGYQSFSKLISNCFTANHHELPTILNPTPSSSPASVSSKQTFNTF